MKLLVGLLINFGASTLKEGLHRIVNDLPSSAAPFMAAFWPQQATPPREPRKGLTLIYVLSDVLDCEILDLDGFI